MTNDSNPAERLAMVEQTDRKLAQRMHWPLWRHAAAGLLQAMFVVSLATPMPLAALVMLAAVSSIFLIGASDRKRHGMFVNGWTSVKARPAIWLALGFTLGGFAAILWLGEGINRWTPWAVPIVGTVFIGVTLASLWWEKLYQAELTAGTGA